MLRKIGFDVVKKANEEMEQPEAASDESKEDQMSYWLNTSSGARHNHRCQHFQKTRRVAFVVPMRASPVASVVDDMNREDSRTVSIGFCNGIRLSVARNAALREPTVGECEGQK